MLLDLSLLAIKEMTRRLRVVDDCDEPPPSWLVTIDGKLLFTKEQWPAHQKEWKKGEALSSISDRKHKPVKERKVPRAHGGTGGGAGHWAKDFRQPKHGGQARRVGSS
jgi:hypothetical protein